MDESLTPQWVAWNERFRALSQKERFPVSMLCSHGRLYPVLGNVSLSTTVCPECEPISYEEYKDFIEQGFEVTTSKGGTGSRSD